MAITADQDCSTSDDIEKPPHDEQLAAVDTGEHIAKGGTRPWKRYARSALVFVVYAGAVGLAGGLGWKLWDEHTVSQAGHAAQRTAINYAQVLTSIDSSQVDQNFSAVLDGATGEFKDTYTKASAQLRQLLIDNKAAAHGTVVDSAIQSQTKNKVVVLLMVDQTVSNAARPDGRVDRSRMKVTMENIGGRWLAGKVELP
ncbi:Mce protein [Mycobacterium vulneris]|uniref:Mce protein n=1 Tax=Mycolicibacterium vulneris TaxID=547163 RepID=A0A1X2L8B5_9MYCO|nr:Mce protein [Mycolicibacterium vulneris]OSC30240.1 Mce protein [Mycolicibacterium vulneris]